MLSSGFGGEKRGASLKDEQHRLEQTGLLSLLLLMFSIVAI